MERETINLPTEKESFDTSYYLSNHSHPNAQEMAQVIRGHWGVEADNYIRDKTFKEDEVKTQYGNQAQIMGRLSSLAMSLIRKPGQKTFKHL